MNSNIIKDQIKRCNRNSIIINIIFSLFLIFLSSEFIPDYYNIIMGPFKLEHDMFVTGSGKTKFSVLGLSNNYTCYAYGDKYYFKIQDDNFINSGVQNATSYSIHGVKSKEHIDSDFLVTRIQDKYLLVRVKKGSNKNNYSGSIVRLAAYTTNDVIEKSDLDIDKSKVLPYIFDATYNIGISDYIKLTIMTIIIAINLSFYVRIFRRIINYKRHPIYNKLSFYGNPEEIEANIQSEVESSAIGKGKSIVLPSWTFKKQWLSIEISKKQVINDKIDGMKYIKRRHKP